ncbi:cadherin-13 [Engraulis encrasicolus]|uniref:cadherin-13 n=1 Tax=Engraulis encrasicolus TaxID=184585 RepID=UPI002FD14F7D
MTGYLFMLMMLSVSCAETHLREKRAWIIDSFSIVEEHPGPYPYELGQIHVERKYRVAFELHGSGVDEEPKGLLSINEETGIVMVHYKIDYEQYKLLKLSFVARNTSNLATDTKLGVEIVVVDINDNAPIFQNTPYVAYVKESATQGSYVLTVLARDDDEDGTENARFDYRITAVTPSTPNVEFFISDHGAISFKGCLSYEEAQKYLITIEAKDHGQISLSSSTTVVVHVQDSNNHLPVFSGHSGTGQVKERETGLSPIRIHVTDKDSQGTAAWRVRYTLHGKMSTLFHVATDPATNDGILTLIQPLDFEDGAERIISVSVENEEAYFSCKVKEKTKQGLWTVVTTKDVETMTSTIQQQFTVTVEDANDPPVFIVSVKDAVVTENESPGRVIEQFSAVDNDVTFTNTFVYKIGDDPADWVRIDPQTGQIFLTHTPDRESHHVVDNVYKVIVLAVDNGNPSMTGTATLSVHVQDQNDNLPTLNATTLGICATDSTTEAVIWAHDLDGDPYGGPFLFQLQNDHQGWSLEPDYGMSATLKKESMVFAGYYTLMLKISDKQGQFSMQNISITVCDCSTSTNCLLSRKGSSITGNGAIGTVFLALFLLLGALLLMAFVSCGGEKTMIDIDGGASGDSWLLKSNTEMPGTDCMVPTESTLTQKVNNSHVKTNNISQKVINTEHQLVNTDGFTQHFNNNQQMSYKYKSYYDIYADSQKYMYEKHQADFKSMAALTQEQHYNYNQHIQASHQNSSFYQQQNNHYKETMTTQRRDVGHDEFTIGDHLDVETLLEARLSSIKALEEELCDYEPHEYDDEGSETLCEDLEPIHMEDPAFDPDELLDLGPGFFPLASISNPELDTHVFAGMF